MGINPHEVQYNAKRIQQGMAPIPYGLATPQAYQRSSGNSNKGSFKDDFTSKEYEIEGFNTAVAEFLINDVALLRTVESAFLHNWEGLYDQYKGDKASFVLQQGERLQENIQELYQLKGAVDAEANAIRNEFAIINNEHWKKVGDHEPLIDGNGDPMLIENEFNESARAYLVENKGYNPERLQGPLTKFIYTNIAHDLPRNMRVIKDYEQVDLQGYYDAKYDFFKTNGNIIGQTDIGGAAYDREKWESGYEAAQKEWNNRVDGSFDLRRARGWLFNQEMEKQKNIVEQMPEPERQKKIAQRNKIRDLQEKINNQGYESLTNSEKDYYERNFAQAVYFDYAGGAGNSYFKKGHAKYTYNKLEDLNDAIMMKDSISKDARPNANNANAKVANRWSDIEQNNYAGMLSGATMATGEFYAGVFSDMADVMPEGPTGKRIYAGTDIPTFTTKVINAGGLESLSGNPAKDSKFLWDNRIDISSEYFIDKFGRNITPLVNTQAEFMDTDERKKLLVSYGGQEWYVDNYFLGKEDVVLRAPKGLLPQLKVVPIKEFLANSDVLSDEQKATATTSDFVKYYGEKTGIIPDYEIFAREADRIHGAGAGAEIKYASTYSLEGDQKYLPGHMQTLMPGQYEHYDVFGGKGENSVLDYPGAMVYTGRIMIGLTQNDGTGESKHLTAKYIVSPDDAEGVIIERKGDDNITLKEQLEKDEFTMEDIKKNSPSLYYIYLKALWGVGPEGNLTEKMIAEGSKYDKYVIQSVAVRLTKRMNAIAIKGENNYKLNAGTSDMISTDGNTAITTHS